MSNRLVCTCNLIDEKEINAMLDKGASSTKDIQEYTRAGTSCGRCLPVIDEIVNTQKKKEPKNQQQKLDFGYSEFFDDNVQ